MADTLIIPDQISNSNGLGYGFDKVSWDNPNGDELYECSFGDYTAKEDGDYRSFVIEVVYDGEKDTWSWDMYYNAYNDNNFLDADVLNGDGYRTFDDAADASFKAYNDHVAEIRKFIDEVDEDVLHDMG